MLLLRQGQTDDEVIVTLTEKTTLTEPCYLFVFTHVTTKEKVKFVKTYEDDASQYPERFNQFSVNTSVLFNGANTGQFLYKVYEQASTTNTDETQTGAEVENGKMNLLPATILTRVEYETTTTIKTYQG